MPEMLQDRIALDRGSVRTVDVDGHLHIALNPISKANVCPYLGSEIPDAAALGLKPDQIYQLYRDPEELRKAAPTADGKPLLIVHRPQSADDHSREVTVGSIKNPVWEAPYLKAELDVWDGEAIAGIEDGSRRELSMGYHYRADMTPGEVNGVKFDGVMRDISINHQALVATGRVGSDVVVGDSAIQQQPQETEVMTATTLPRSVQVAAIALDTYLRPKLLAGTALATLDLNKLLTGKTGKAWATSKPAIKLGLDAAVKGKLAKDADISDVIEMLDRLDDVVDEEEPTPRGSDDMTGELSEDEEAQYQALAKRRTPEAAETPVEDAEPAAEEPDDDDEEAKKKKAAEAKDKAAKDKAAKDKAAKDKAAKDKQAKDGMMITKAAMDAALAEQATKTEAATIARLSAIREAERDVRPWVGEIVIPQKSAEDVYRLALDTLKVDVKGLHPDALRPILMAQPKPGDEAQRRPVRLATDSAAFEDEYTKMFPNHNRLMGA